MTSASDLRSGKTHRDENFPVASWIIHPRHRALILSHGFRWLGAGMARGRLNGRAGTTWVLHVGS